VVMEDLSTEAIIGKLETEKDKTIVADAFNCKFYSPYIALIQGSGLSEIAWCMEFYSAGYSCLPPGSYLSPLVGKLLTNDGLVDFYISSEQWAVELLIGGSYSKIPIKSHLILDIREKKSPSKTYVNVWPILPNTDYKIFCVVNISQEEFSINVDYIDVYETTAKKRRHNVNQRNLNDLVDSFSRKP
ncbi:22039_t:CDS:2, partial [Entrophospora sp. SA101]